MLFEDKIVAFSESDFVNFQLFIRNHFHPSYILSDKTFFDWQYKNGLGRNKYSILLLKDQNQIYGCIGLIPKKYKILDQTVKTNEYINLFVDPKLRSLGLGTVLVKKAMAQGTAVNVGYSAETSSLYKKLGNWRDLGGLNRYLVVLDEKKLDHFLSNQTFKIRNKRNYLSHETNPKNNLDFKYIKSFDRNFDDLWLKVSSRYPIAAQRDSLYLNWRYSEHPSFAYSILQVSRGKNLLGFLIYRFETVDDFKIARIVDFVSFSEVELDLFAKFIIDAKHGGACVADFVFFGDFYHTSLEKAGFFKEEPVQFPLRFNPVSYSKKSIGLMVFSGDEKINPEEFYKVDNWYITRGDSDQDRPNPR